MWKEWPWPRFFETLGLCLGCANWLESGASRVSHMPASYQLSLLTSWYSVQLCVKALPSPQCFQTSCTSFTITSLANSLKSLVLGGLLWQLTSSRNSSLLGCICMCARGREISVCEQRGIKDASQAENNWLASCVLLCEGPQCEWISILVDSSCQAEPVWCRASKNWRELSFCTEEENGARTCSN